ncbi:hypothetical protein MKEN_01345400 [Mycena kentingensis (nom. inval.)]|nr:hypothetical protein MKEN_01345400 [Mycena kentingensis (nom. inval.)]
MQSQLTLVNPTAPAIYIFTPNSMSAATILKGSTPVYKTKTGETVDSTTITEYFETGVLAAKISQRQGEQMDEGGQTHQWRLAAPYGFKCILKMDVKTRLALFCELDAEKPIAYWRSDPANLRKSISLVIEREIAPEFELHVLVAFMIAEYKMRLEERRSVGAEALALATHDAGYASHGTGAYQT